MTKPITLEPRNPVTPTYKGKTRYQDSQIADDYDRKRFTGFKGRLVDKMEKKGLVRILRRVPDSAEALDIPCGTGRMTELLLERGMDVTASDISVAMIKHAENRIATKDTPVRFIEADIENLAFENESFDLIVTIRLLHHLPSSVRRRVLSQLHRVSRKWVAITFSSKYSLQSARRGLLAKFSGVPRYSISPHVFKRDVADAGFNIVEYVRLVPIISESVFVLLEKR